MTEQVQRNLKEIKNGAFDVRKANCRSWLSEKSSLAAMQMAQVTSEASHDVFNSEKEPSSAMVGDRGWDNFSRAEALMGMDWV